MSNKKEKVEVLETMELNPNKYKLNSPQFRGKALPKTAQRKAMVYTR